MFAFTGQMIGAAPSWGLADPVGQGPFSLQSHSFPVVFDGQTLQQVSPFTVHSPDA